MFETIDPQPYRFSWGEPTWTTAPSYDNALAEFLGDLACRRDIPEEQTISLAQRALVREITIRSSASEPDSVKLAHSWSKLFAIRVTGPNCPPAKGLPENMWRQLVEIAAWSDLPEPPEAIAPGSR